MKRGFKSHSSIFKLKVEQTEYIIMFSALQVHERK